MPINTIEIKINTPYLIVSDSNEKVDVFWEKCSQKRNSAKFSFKWIFTKRRKCSLFTALFGSCPPPAECCRCHELVWSSLHFALWWHHYLSTNALQVLQHSSSPLKDIHIKQFLSLRWWQWTHLGALVWRDNFAHQRQSSSTAAASTPTLGDLSQTKEPQQAGSKWEWKHFSWPQRPRTGEDFFVRSNIQDNADAVSPQLIAHVFFNNASYLLLCLT